jgi:hypothetical protein
MKYYLPHVCNSVYIKLIFCALTLYAVSTVTSNLPL